MSENLYDRLGGQPGIDKLVDRILDRHLANELVGTRFRVLDEATLNKSRKLAKQFFAAGSGGPAEYTGRSMLEAHRGMNIDAAEYLAVVDDIMQAMQDLDYPQAVRDEVLAITYSLKNEIIRQ